MQKSDITQTDESPVPHHLKKQRILETSSDDYVASSNNGWYINSETVELTGPLTGDQIREYIDNGIIDGLTYVWQEGKSEWTRLCDTSELNNILVRIESVDIDDKIRQPLESVSEKFKYIPEDGIGQVYDIITKKWMSFTEYQSLDISGTTEHSFDKKSRNAESRKRFKEKLHEKKKAGEFVKAKVNTNVYVTGLPVDVSEDELAENFKKAGVIKIDPETSRPKIKIYRTADGKCNGDCRISYVYQTSVDLAIKYLNGNCLRGTNYPMNVEQAVFNHKVEKIDINKVIPENPVEKKKRLLAARLEERRLLAWNDGISTKGLRVMILRPLWSLKEAATNTSDFFKLIAKQVQDSISIWSSGIKTTAIDRHPNGIVCVKFSTTEACEAACARLNGQLFRHLNMPERERMFSFSLFEDFEFSHTGEIDLLPDEDVNDIYIQELAHGIMTKIPDGFSPDNKKHKVYDTAKHSNNHGNDTPYQIESAKGKLLIKFLKSRQIRLEAYVYDGKTDLRDQAIPESRDIKPVNDSVEQNQKQDKEVPIIGGEEWATWLANQDSDDDDLTIHTEEEV